MFVAVVGAIVVVVVLLLLIVAELLVEAIGAAVKFVSLDTLASIIVKLLGPAPIVKREPAKRKRNSSYI